MFHIQFHTLFLLIFICFSSNVCAKLSKNAYAILGVPKDATQAEINKAYRHLAVELHPDNNDGKSDSFMELTAAYEYLKTPEARQKYDLYGEDDPTQKQNPNPNQRGGFSYGMDGVPFDISEILNAMHNGGHFGKNKQYTQRAPINVFKGSDVDEITSKNEIQNEILICFYKNLKNPNFISDFKKLAKTLKPFLNVGAVNCDSNQNLCRSYNISQSPTLALFWPPKTNKIKFTTPSEKHISSYSDMMKWVNKNAYFEAQNLTKENINAWLNNYPEQPKLVLFSTDSPPITFKTVLNKFEQKLKIGYVKSPKSALIKSFEQTPKFPSILYLKNYDNLSGKVVMVDMNSEKSIINMLTEVLADKRSEYKKYGKSTEYAELTKRRFETGECGPNDSQLCIIHLNDHSKYSQKMDDLLSSISQKYKYDPVKFVWVDINNQPNFANAFDSSFVKPSTYLIALRPKRQKYAIFDGNITQSSQVDEIIEKLLTGSLSIDLKLRHPLQITTQFSSKFEEL